jgi:SHS2 domain-containing protein
VKGGHAYEFVEGVTSDLSFVARGGTPEEVFAAAAEALLAATVEDPATVGGRERRSLVLQEPALDLLLLRFLNELVYLRDAEELLLRPTKLRISQEPGARLEVELAGEKIDWERHCMETEVKAVTPHGLAVTATARGWEATVTLDV